MPWSELERVLSGPAPGPGRSAVATIVHDPITIDHGDGGDTPAWTRKRAQLRARRSSSGQTSTVPYAELHCHSNFSFLDGASHPEELAEEAARLGLTALAVTDHDGFYGVVRFAEAARDAGPADRLRRRAVPRACPARRTASPTRPGAHLLVLARGPEGYARLCRAIMPRPSCAGGEKGRPVYDLERARRASCAATCWCSPAAARGTVPAALLTDGVDAAAAASWTG